MWVLGLIVVGVVFYFILESVKKEKEKDEQEQKKKEYQEWKEKEKIENAKTPKGRAKQLLEDLFEGPLMHYKNVAHNVLTYAEMRAIQRGQELGGQHISHMIQESFDQIRVGKYLFLAVYLMLIAKGRANLVLEVPELADVPNQGLAIRLVLVDALEELKNGSTDSDEDDEDDDDIAV